MRGPTHIGKVFLAAAAAAVLACSGVTAAENREDDRNGVPMTESAAGIDAVTSATRALYPDRAFRIGIIDLSDARGEAGILSDTIERLREAFAPYRIEVAGYSSRELETAICTGSVDAFIASSGFYWRMIPLGARDVATLISRDSPDPNHTCAITFITSAQNSSVRTFEDMRGKRLSASYPTAFMGYRIGLAEIAAKGEDPDTFFSSVTFSHEPAIEAIAGKVLNGEADVAFIQSCWLETLSPEERARFRVISPVDTPAGNCVRSTAAYPNITAAVLRDAPPGAAREIAKVLLTMPANEKGEHWGLATNFKSVNNVYRLLKIEHYAYLREPSLQRWIAEHRPWLATAGFCLLLLIAHSFVVGYLVRRRTRELARAHAENEAARRRYEALFDRMEKFRKANTVSQLSSMIAHELAQPVGAAVSYCNGLKLLSEKKTLTPEKLEAGLSGLAKVLTRVGGIIDKVRSYSKGNVDRDQSHALASILTTARDSLSKVLKESVAIDFDIPAGVSVAGDELELELLFNNLFSNAAAAAGQTDDRRLTVRALVQDETVLVGVENPGRILDARDIARLTTPFVSERGPGHGLGVPISMSLAEANGGHLSYEARSEGGLTALVTLRGAGSH